MKRLIFVVSLAFAVVVLAVPDLCPHEFELDSTNYVSGNTELYYTVRSSGGNPAHAISHWVYPECETWPEDVWVYSSEEVERVSSDPTTGMSGYKFDVGYNDYEVRRIEIILKGYWEIGEIIVAVKAGGNICYIETEGAICEEYEQSYEPVKPVLECVNWDDGVCTIHWGAMNYNNHVVTIPHGDNNKMTPDRYTPELPTEFPPGRSYDWFTVVIDDDFDYNLVWTLEGPDGSRRTATASKNSKLCEFVPTELDDFVVVIQLYLDENENGKFDSGESLIVGADVVMDRGSGYKPWRTVTTAWQHLYGNKKMPYNAIFDNMQEGAFEAVFDINMPGGVFYYFTQAPSVIEKYANEPCYEVVPIGVVSDLADEFLSYRSENYVPDDLPDLNPEIDGLQLALGTSFYTKGAKEWGWVNVLNGNELWAYRMSEIPWAIFQYPEERVFNYIKWSPGKVYSDKQPVQKIEVYTASDVGEAWAYQGHSVAKGDMNWMSMGEEVTARYIKLVLVAPVYGNYLTMDLFWPNYNKAEAKLANEFDGVRPIECLFETNAYPNPFNPMVTIKFSLPVSDVVKISIYNLLGAKVEDLMVGKELAKGEHVAMWDGGAFSSGIYYYVIQTNKGRMAKGNLVLLK